MADTDKEDRSTRLMYAVTAMSAAFGARKLLIFAWTKATGKRPPLNPEDPQETLVEALGWSVLVGITVAIVRVFAIRAVSRSSLRGANRESVTAADG